MKAKTKSELITENRTLRRHASDLHWLARRYADGQFSYATHAFNDITRSLLKIGVTLNPCYDQRIWAYDGMGRKYDGLTPKDLELERNYGKEPAR